VRLAGWLAGAGHEVRVWTLLPEADLAPALDRHGVAVQLLPQARPRGPLTVAALTRELRGYRPDVAVSFLYQSNMVTRAAARAAGVPVVVSSIRNEHFGSRLRELAVRATDGLADVTTTNSRIAAAGLVRRRLVPRRRLVVVPNALDPDAFAERPVRPALRAE